MQSFIESGDAGVAGSCNGAHTAIVVAVVLALSGCAPMGTYEAEVCRSWSTQWDWACPRDYIRVDMDE